MGLNIGIHLSSNRTSINTNTENKYLYLTLNYFLKFPQHGSTWVPFVFLKFYVSLKPWGRGKPVFVLVHVCNESVIPFPVVVSRLSSRVYHLGSCYLLWSSPLASVSRHWTFVPGIRSSKDTEGRELRPQFPWVLCTNQLKDWRYFVSDDTWSLSSMGTEWESTTHLLSIYESIKRP